MGSSPWKLRAEAGSGRRCTARHWYPQPAPPLRASAGGSPQTSQKGELQIGVPRPRWYARRMNDAEQEEIHHAINAALDELAEQLGGTSDTGGPVENATQIKGRGDLGILLTDVANNVLGRVWVVFDAGI